MARRNKRGQKKGRQSQNHLSSEFTISEIKNPFAGIPQEKLEQIVSEIAQSSVKEFDETLS